MNIPRNILLNRLIKAKDHHLIKVITGMRRCGKSYLLFTLFKNHLLQAGVHASQIIEINLEDPAFINLRDAIALDTHLRTRLKSATKETFVLIDEIQLARRVLPTGVDISRFAPEDRSDCYVTFYDVLNGLLHNPLINVYITGSNARLLSTEISTYFRGRSETIEVMPLSFAEFRPTLPEGMEFAEARDLYFTYGGLPECVLRTAERDKQEYLKDILYTIYLRDIAERHDLHSCDLLEKVTDFAMSGIGCLTNHTKLANALTSNGTKANHVTIGKYLSYLEDAFLLKKAARYDVKGKRYLNTQFKYYAVDTGIRNSQLNFRQVELSHLMENAIHNELIRRGYSVDVGIVDTHPLVDGIQKCVQREIDFVVNNGSERIYVQSAFAIPDESKLEQETKSLRHVRDGFRRIVITADNYGSPHMDDNGITFMGLKHFFLDPKSIETL